VATVVSVNFIFRANYWTSFLFTTTLVHDIVEQPLANHVKETSLVELKV